MKQFKWWWVILVLMLAAFVRVYKLAEIPAGVYYDEIDLAYQARSLIETGKDYRGTWSPFYMWSFHDLKTPLPIYLSVPAALLFKTPELQVRMTTAVAGIAVVGLAMLLVWMWTKNKLAAAMTGLVFALNPWQIQFSRIAFEAIFVLLFYFGFLILFFRWLKTKRLRDYYWSIVLLSLGVYVYRVMSFYVPLTFLMVGVIYFRDIWKVGLKHVVMGVAMAAVIILPFLYATVVVAPDKTRFEQVSIFSDPEVPIFVMRNREVDSGDYKTETLGERPVWSSFAIHNKVVSWVVSLKNNYLRSFSTEFLFVDGDPNLRQGLGKTGALLLIDVVGLGMGLFWLAKNIKDKKYQLLAAWLLTGSLPADLTMGGAFHASRLITFSAPLLVVVGLGWWQVVKWVRAQRWQKLGMAVLVFGWVIAFGVVAHKYLVHFPLESARWHGYGYKQAILKIVEVDDQYEKIMLTFSNDPPMMYYLFWAQVPAKEVQDYGPRFTTDVHKNQRLDKYKAMSWSKVTEGWDMPSQMGQALEEGVLYMITQQDAKFDLRPGQGSLPAGVKLVDMVTYPDNSEVAYYLITKENGKF